MLFALEYLKDLNATRAYREVYGVKQKVAEANGPRLLGNARVAALVNGAMQKRAEKLEVNADKVLAEIGHMAYLDPLEMYDENNCLKPIAEIPETLRRAIASIETKELFEGAGKDREMIGYTKTVKLWNKPGSLELHGKHLKLFTDKVEHTVSDSLAKLILNGTAS